MEQSRDDRTTARKNAALALLEPTDEHISRTQNEVDACLIRLRAARDRADLAAYDLQ
jgi:hypothetical protein